MAVHAMTKSELDEIERAEAAEQNAVRAALEQPRTRWPAALVPVHAILDGIEAEIGSLAPLLARAAAPVQLLWHRLFAGPDALYLSLLHAIRLADGFARWPDPAELCLGGPEPGLLAEHAGRAAVLTAWWQDGKAGQALTRARGDARDRYRLGPEWEGVALAVAKRVDALLTAGFGATVDLVPDYTHRLALHHRARMLFVELAGLALLAHVLDAGGLPRLDPADLRGALPDLRGDVDTSRRWALYRWLARMIQQAYADDPDSVFTDNDACVRADPRRAMIADMINGPFFTRDARIARDQSNLHWSRDGLGRDEENSFFQLGFTQGVFRSAKTMLDALCSHLARAVVATGRTPVYLYDGATGSGAVPRTVYQLVTRIAPAMANELRCQLADVAAASLQSAWAACAGHPGMGVYRADLAAPVIAPGDHGTFDIAGQNLGAHHVPDDEYAAMIRGFVALTRPGGLIYLGDVDERIGLQLLNGLWANLYAVEWPRVSADPYRMVTPPSTLAVDCRGIDVRGLNDATNYVDADIFKIMVMIPDAARAFPRDLAFYTMGFGYVSVVDRAQLERIDQLAEQGRDWHGVLEQPGSLSARLARDQAALAERITALPDPR